MEATNHVRVKICCISSVQEARRAIVLGASAIGLVGPMPSGPGVIDDRLIQEIAGHVPPPVATFLLTSRTNAPDIIAHHRTVNTTTIQIVDALSDSGYRHIREAIPAVKLVQVIHVTGEESIDEAQAVAPYVDAILLDSGNPNLAVKELGGTGGTHNWAWRRTIREEVDVPVLLAGGLHAGNVRQAIDEVQPFGVDLCSGVRTQGSLDISKLAEFLSAVNSR